MGEPTKKWNPLTYVCLLAGVILMATAVFFMFRGSINPQKNEEIAKKAEDVYEADKSNKPVYVNIQYMSEAIAYKEALPDMQYYLTFDKELNPALVCVHDDDLKAYQEYIDWMYNEDVAEAPAAGVMYGYSVKTDSDLRGFVIEAYNMLFGEEYLNDRNFDTFFGEYYLVMGQERSQYDSFNKGIYCMLAAVIVIVIGVALSYQAMKPEEVPGNATCLEVHKTHRVRGVLGALVGALLGGILWAAVGALGYISGWIGILTLLFAKTGYSLFAKEEGKLGTVCSLIFSLLMVLPATYLGGVWNYYQELNKMMPVYISLGRATKGLMEYLSEAGDLESVIYNIGMGYLFMLLAAGHLVTRTAKKEQQKQSDIAARAGLNVKLPGEDWKND